MANRDPLDVHIGERLKAARVRRRMTLGAAGRLVGVAYQQIQKYETGANRIAAATLFRLCAFYGLAAASVFDGYAEAELPGAEAAGPTMPSVDDIDLIPDPDLREHVRALAKALAKTT